MANTRVTVTQTDQFSIVIEAATQRAANSLALATQRAAFNTTPVRTGRLVSNTKVDRANKVGIRRFQSRVYNNTPYAGHVHGGTGLYAGRGYITGNPIMQWTNAGGPYAGTWRAAAVRGQPAQPFLVEAYNFGRLQLGYINNVMAMTVPPAQSAPPYNDAIQQVRQIR